MSSYASVFIVWANPREIIEYEHDVHGDFVYNDDGSKKILSSAPSFLAALSDQEICDTVLNMWVNSKPGRIGAVTYCISDNGFHHLHMVLEVENADSDRFTFKQVQKIYGKKFHIEPTRGSKKEAEDYILKRGKYAEKGEVVTATSQYGELKGNQGKRTDIKALELLLDEGHTPQEILDMVGISAYRYRILLNEVYMRNREIEVGARRCITTYYHTGESYSGKSYTMYKLDDKYGKSNVYKLSDYKNGFDKYEGQPVLFMDELRPYSMSYVTLLSILNEATLDIHCRFSNKKMLWDEVHITSVIPPEEMYFGMVPLSERKYDTFKQLSNRITYVVYHWHDSDGYHDFTVPMQQYHNYDDLKYAALHQDEILENGFRHCSVADQVEINTIFSQMKMVGI